uniref:BPTI/Kunitz inhibitor domain-containing protein n=1 Tax=Plectus sambesii TaxID=2011161 RepID=A0A914VER8_9BILA
MKTVIAAIVAFLFVAVYAAPTTNSMCDEPKPVASCALDAQATQKWQWHYAQDKNECVAFIYGGCRGSTNNFETKEACDAACKPQGSEQKIGQLIATGTLPTTTTSATSTTSPTSTTTVTSTIAAGGGPLANLGK